MLDGLTSSDKDALRKECGWLGFASLSANLLAHPVPNIGELDETLRRNDVHDEVIVLTGQTVRNEASMRRLAHDGWKLDELDQRYGDFVAAFRPVMTALQKQPEISDQTAFLTRILLIQEYRKIMLRDPLLPQELLPADWQGRAAYRLCNNLYRAIHKPADAYLGDVAETADGPMPAPATAFYQRFDGLDAKPASQSWLK